jgi:C4-dicarboxylate transporter DctM subunit
MFLRILDRLEETIIAALMGAATVLTFVAVAHRFLVNVPFLYPILFPIRLAWSQELCIYMFIWMAKFGAAYGVRTGIHVGVDVLIKRLNNPWRRGVILFGLLGGALFTAIVGTMGAKFVIELMSTDQVSPDLELPSWIVYACIPLGSYLMCFRFLQVCWSFWKTGELPHHDATNVDGIEVTSAAAPIESVGLKLFSGLDNFGIMAIPFFILAGTFLTRGGVARRMITFTTSVVGHFNGGLGLAGVAACAMFAAISGSSVATVVAIGSIMMPAMVEHGYPRRFGVGVIATSGALGILVPPSIILVLYGVSTNTSIGALFMAGIVPGILLALMLAAVTWFIARRNDYPRMPKATFRQQVSAFRESFWGLALIAIVLGGIYGGIFTPTEAAAVAAVYAFVITVFVYKELKLTEVPKVLLQAASMSSMLLYIITNAVLFSFLMTHEQIPQEMAAWIIDKNFGVWTFLLVVNVILLAAGNVMDPSSILLIMAPILYPLATKLGINPVHLGVLMIVNTEVGLCHPPVGLNLYIASGIVKMGISEITVAVLPWLCAMLIFLALITYVPEISLWLPHLLGML